MTGIITCNDTGSAENYNLGGKAENLSRLKEYGFNVPDWVTIPQEMLIEIINGNADAVACINEYIFPQNFIKEILAFFPDTKYFAVRSSAVGEDGDDFSFAGQFESYMYVSPEKLEENIKKVWRSAYSERVRLYREFNKISIVPGTAVIIHKMIPADAAGVAFGINPATGNRKEKLINTVYGLGEGLVSGQLDADSFTIFDNTITFIAADKTHKIMPAPEGGTYTAEVPAEERKLPAVNNDCIFELCSMLDVIQQKTGKPQDVEFAVAAGTVYLLQTRPVTGLQKLQDPLGHYIVWDNSNIIESYPGITSPLTFSFIIKIYEAVYRQAVSIMGGSPGEINENEQVFKNMLGLLNGRVYYNLLSWYKTLALLPGYSLNAGFMEKMMGVKEKFVSEKPLKKTSPADYFKVAAAVVKLIASLISLPRKREIFLKDLEAHIAEFKAIDLKKCSAEKLMAIYLDTEQVLLQKWRAPIINDFFAMIYFGVLQKLVVKYSIDTTGSLHNNLLCGAKDIISTEPIRLSLQIADAVIADENLKKIFSNFSPEDVWEKLNEKQFAGLRVLVSNYLGKFGDRCMGELKLETVTYNQNPAAYISIIQSYVRQNIHTGSYRSDADIRMRREAEEKVTQALKGRVLKKIIFHHFLKGARSLVSNRENLRYERTRAFSIVRNIFSETGNRFYSEGIISAPRDIFYLTKEEIFDFIKGTSVTPGLKKLITLRKEEYAGFEKENTADRIATRGIVYHGNNFTISPALPRETQEGEPYLKGIGCCPGRIKAKVQVITNPYEISSLNGDILVTSTTDPGWVTLFPTASAILVERGSLLSHSAIVSREMGIPCIVSITGLLQKLKTGDVVEMDGSTGEIKIIK